MVSKIPQDKKQRQQDKNPAQHVGGIGVSREETLKKSGGDQHRRQSDQDFHPPAHRQLEGAHSRVRAGE